MRFASRVILLFLLGACATQAARHDFDERTVLRFGGTAEFPDGLRVTFTRLVSDSRCPVNVTCIQAGAAVVELTCSHDNQSMPIRLSTERAMDRADVLGDRVELLSVDPPPITTRHAAPEYSVTIRVTRPSAGRS